MAVDENAIAEPRNTLFSWSFGIDLDQERDPGKAFVLF